MKHITGGVTAAKGFEAAGVKAQVKYSEQEGHGDGVQPHALQGGGGVSPATW